MINNLPKHIMTETEKAYIEAYRQIRQAMLNLENFIHDMPALEGETEITWGHVGDMNRIKAAIEEIYAQ